MRTSISSKISLKVMTKSELEEKLNRSEQNIKNGQVYSQNEVKSFFKNRFQ